jgi:hypothetical protein
VSDNQKFLEQLQKMNELSLESLMNQRRQKRVSKKLKQDSNNMFRDLQNQLPKVNAPTNNSGLSNDLMDLLNKLSK